MFISLPRPAIIAHRGASAHAPENTVAAFELAVQKGADAVELDAKLSGDGQVMVIHDQSVNRTTNGKGLVRQLTLAELKKLDAGSSFGAAFQGEKIPTLSDVFEAVGKRIPINIEITNYASATDELPEKICTLIKKHNLAEYVFFSSFNPLSLIRARRALPQVPGGLLALPGKPGNWARGWLGRMVGYQALHPELGDATPALVENEHQRGKRVHVYTVNEPADLRRMFAFRVDGVFTDDPTLARQVLTGQAD